MPELIPAAPGTPDLAKVDRILTDLQSQLLDYDPEQEDWDEVVEMAMNDAWDLLLKAGPHA